MARIADMLARRWNALDGRSKPVVQYLLFAAALIAMIGVLYIRYILGRHTLIFVEAGSDSWAQSLPFFLNAAERFSELDFSTWDFSQFLGAQTIQAVNPEYLVSVFGKDLVGPMMLASQMAKVFLAGTFFYLYTSYWNVRYLTRFASSLGVAFCGRMVALAAWTAYTLEVTLAVALLWAFERFLADPRKFTALPIVFALLIATLGVYGTVLYSFVMLVYVVFRIGYGNHRLASARSIGVFVAQLLLLYVTGILLIAVTLFPIAEGYLDSARIASNSEGIQLPQTISADIYAAEGLSLFTPSALGTMADYAGPCNTLNNPYFYCGAFLLLGAPFAFQRKTRRQRVWLAVLSALALAYVASPSFRYILNGFGVGGHDFRMSSFWITIVLAVLGMLGIDELLKGTRTAPLALAAAALLAVLALCCIGLLDYVRAPWVALSAALLVLYAALFSRAGTGPRRALSVGLIATLCVFELLAQSWALANDVPTATKDDYRYEYANGFTELIDEVDGNDDDLYRLDWKTPLLTRSMAYGYHGTQAYIGGTGISKPLTEFMANMASNDYIDELGYSRYTYGFYDNSINTLLGVRYLAYDARNEPEGTARYVPYGYHPVDADGSGFCIYENDYALPFFMSYSYDEAVDDGQILALDRSDRGLALLESCAVPREHEHASGSAASSPVSEGTTMLAASDGSLTSDESAAGEQDPIRVDFPASDEPYLLVEVTVDAKAVEGANMTLGISLENGTSGESITIPYLTAAGREEISLPVENKGYTRAYVDFIRHNSAGNPITVSGLEVRGASESYFGRYRAACEDKLAESPKMTKVESDMVGGSIDVADDGYIVTSIPWSASWHAFIDGAEVETIPVNFGFVGMRAPAGHHDIEVVYRDRPREIGGWVSLAALLGLAATRVGTGIAGRSRRAAV